MFIRVFVGSGGMVVLMCVTRVCGAVCFCREVVTSTAISKLLQGSEQQGERSQPCNRITIDEGVPVIQSLSTQTDIIAYTIVF